MTATTADEGARAAPGAAPVYSANYKRLVLFLLVLAYTFSFIDRTIISILGQSIKESLKISDAQLGALGGLYFALLYTFLGIPIARLAERASRVNIIAVAIALWSAFTAFCGSAGSYVILAACRFGVGIGEAGLSPPAHSLISDYFPPKERASALSMYSFGIPLGSMLGLILGGWIAGAFSWRMAFVVVGAPGLIIALLIKLLIKEPPRGHSEVAQHPQVAEDVTAETHDSPRPLTLKKGGEWAEMWAVCKILFGKWAVLNMVLGITLVSFGGYGGGQFAPPYFQRAFHLGVAQAGLIIGVA
ncbi:MAG: MFS transporter, partial [Proteobacteria bacterium]|nr:MFS transporter [Pseudomonadota bacterium]